MLVEISHTTSKKWRKIPDANNLSDTSTRVIVYVKLKYTYIHIKGIPKKNIDCFILFFIAVILLILFNNINFICGRLVLQCNRIDNIFTDVSMYDIVYILRERPSCYVQAMIRKSTSIPRTSSIDLFQYFAIHVQM